MIRTLRAAAAAVLFLFVSDSASLLAQPTGPQHLVVAGLRSVLHQGGFNAVATDPAGNLYLLIDQKDGVRLLKTDAAAATVLAQVLLGGPGDVGLAVALDPAGNVYITGTSSSGVLVASSGAIFPAPAGTAVNSFVAKFDSNLNLGFLTFCGSGRTSANALAATADAVFVTGLIIGSELPVTPSAVLQTPAAGSMENGFVERFSTDGSKLLYATYLTGVGGDTVPMAIAATSADEAFLGGFTSATGFPTVAALVPRALAPTSGFLMKLTPGGDGITFSTFVPGSVVTSLAVDPVTNNLLVSGQISLGQFPVASAPAPLVDLPYQVLVRLPLDGSAVLSSTVIAPGMQSALTTAAGVVWIAGTLPVPLLPLLPLADMGSGYGVRVSSTGTQGSFAVDQTVRFGGVASTNFASLPLTLTSLAMDASGSAVFAGTIAPSASSDLLATETYDLPVTNPPTATLPSSIHDAVLPPGTCDGSSCAGSAGYLARVIPAAGASLTLSVDTSPLILIRNLGSTPATGFQVTAAGFTITATCGTTLAAGGECTALLTGPGPGSITVQADNAMSQTATLPAPPAIANPDTIVFTPKELDFGIQTAASSPLSRTLTVTNLGATSQTFTSALNGRSNITPYTFAETASTCPVAGLSSSKQLAPGASCTVDLSLTASPDPTKDAIALASWTIGSGHVVLTGYTQAAALSPSSAAIDFGTQFNGGLSSARYLYLSNNSDTSFTHTTVALPSGSPFSLTDLCPLQLQPHTVCQLQFGYLSASATSSDSVTLTLDQGLAVLISGETIPQPGADGSTVNPNLAVSPTAISFPTAVAVTNVSSGTESVTIQNTGSAPFSLSLALTGDFTMQTSCTATLAAKATCTAVLTFAPSQPGVRTGLVAVTAGSGTAPAYIFLTGTGTPILPPNNGTLSFGSVSVGLPAVQWYKVAQSFTTLTAATSAPTYKVVLVEDLGVGHGQPPSSSFLAATTGGCLNCWLGIQFTPSATGPQSATLSLASSLNGNASTLSLAGTGAAVTGVLLTPLDQDFGAVAVNSSSASAIFTLTNVTPGGVPITLSAPTVTGDFSIGASLLGGSPCAGTLAVNASCFLQVLFAPTATGQRLGTLTLPTSAGSPSVALTGFGSPALDIAINPSALLFNSVPGIAATQQTITLTNTSAGPLQVGLPSNANPAFSVATTCGTLAPAATCTITVTLVPAAATIADTLQVPVTTGAGGQVKTYSVPLAATYTAQSSGLIILPANADYGAAPVNLLAGTRQFTITNLAAKTLALAIALPRHFILSGPPCITLAPNASCDFSVSFLPLTNGAITGTILASATPDDATPAITGLGTLQGYGIGTNSLTVTGNLRPGRIIDFGQVPSGQSVQQLLTLTNTSAATSPAAGSALTIRRIRSLWPFLSTTTCGSTLTVGQSCTVTVTYTPLNQILAGSASFPVTTDAGTLTIESDADSGPDQVNLVGTAAPAAVGSPSNNAPSITFVASDNALTFPGTPIGFTSAPQFVTLNNTGNTVLHISNIITAADFIVTGACAALVPGATCVLTVTFVPQVSSSPTGLRIGAVEITSDSSTSLEFLSLFGTASPSSLIFQPASLDFGTQLVGTTATLPILITNADVTPAIFSSVATTGDYAAASTCPAAGLSLPPHTSCTVTVSFAPLGTGSRPGTLNLATSISTFPLTAKLAGIGVQSYLRISTTSLNFSSTTLGATSNLTLTLANTGTAPIAGVGLVVASDPAGEFSVAAPCPLTILLAGGSCSLTIAFTPHLAGVRSGTLTILSSDPTSPSVVALSGSGTSAGLPGNASFSLTVNGTSTATQTIQPTQPTSFTLAVTPLNGYTGTVVLTCAAVTAAPGAVCSIPGTVTLSGASQSAVASINIAGSATLRKPSFGSLPSVLTFCTLIPSAIFMFGMRRHPYFRGHPASLVVALLSITMLLLAAGCGNSGTATPPHPTPSGSYQYTVIASSTTGTPVTQAVTLNLTIP